MNRFCTRSAWLLRVLLWSLLLAAWARADTMLGPGSLVGPVSSDLKLWAAALIAVELVIAGFEWILDLLGERMRTWAFTRRAAQFVRWHFEANEEQLDLYEERPEWRTP